MKVPITLIFSSILLLLIINSVWNIISIFQVPSCRKTDICYYSYLNNRPTLDLFAFISDNSKDVDFAKILHVEKFNYHEKLEKTISIKLTESVRQNGSIFMHVVLIPSRAHSRHDLQYLLNHPDSTYFKSKLTKYYESVSGKFNLLGDKTMKPTSTKPVSHIRSKFAFVMCPADLHIPHHNIPAEIIKQLRFVTGNRFLPIVQRDIISMRIQDLIEVVSNMKEINIKFIYNPVSYGKLRFMLQIESTLNQFLHLGFNEKDIDEIKNIFADSNLYILCIMITIGGIHLLLDFLSFRNEIGFWKTQKTMVGLSRRTVFWRAFSQVVIFLYLLNENTSMLVLIPSGIATVIEFWKVSKVLNIIVSWSGGLKFEKVFKSAEEKKTQEYDEECMKYLSFILYPLCVLAAIYSLVYHPQKSWYSWIVTSLVNGVYAFGFLFMMPQLFINYRLKSVSALPWRAFTYRAFNTFIDDIFAFIITMPTSHRLACFRDDVVFLIYLYQKWLYPVDESRKDDSGFDYHSNEEKSSKKKVQ